MIPWIGTLGLAIFLGLAILTLPDRRPEVALHPPKESPTSFTWILEMGGTTDPLPALLDTTPLYLPTEWNYSPQLAQAPLMVTLPAPVGPIQVSSVIDRQSIWDQVSPRLPFFQQDIMPREISGRATLPFHRFWKTYQPASTLPRPPTEPARLSVQIQRLGSEGKPMIQEVAAPADWTNPEGLIQPLSFQAIVTPEGLWGISSLDPSLREGNVEASIRNVIQSLPLWRSTSPGTYQVIVGPF